MNAMPAIDLSLLPTTLDLLHVCLIAALLVLPVVGWAISSAAKKTECRVAPESRADETAGASPDAALQLLALLQNEARFVDFVQENIAAYGDAEIGAAARVVHDGCRKVLDAHLPLAPIRTEREGEPVALAGDFDAAAVRLTGRIVGTPPFHGVVTHRGWRVVDIKLPATLAGHDPRILARAEVEL